jgi:hypothetical protein
MSKGRAQFGGSKKPVERAADDGGVCGAAIVDVPTGSAR